jgi:hypothetical protein
MENDIVCVLEGAVAVTLREGVVSPSDQLSNVHCVSLPCIEGVETVHDRFSGHDKDVGAVCVPVVHPVPETLNCTPATLLAMFTCAVRRANVAVIAFGAFIVTDSGLVVPLASPDHPWN